MRAEGYRYVSRLTNLAFQIYVEFGDPARPSLFRVGDDTTPFGATNTDNPAGTYRVSGDVSGVKELLFSVQDGEFVFGKTEVLAELSLEELVIETDGFLDLFLGGPERSTNWLPLAPEAVYLNVREFVGDWENDALASLYIERIDDIGPIGNLTPAAHAAALGRVATWVEASVDVWKTYVAGLRSFLPVNELQALTSRWAAPTTCSTAPGSGNSSPTPPSSWSSISPRSPTGRSRPTCSTGWCWLDFANRVTSLNDRQLHEDDDGLVRVLLSHTDPGVQNWLDTSELREGLFTYRYVRPTTAPAPRATLVKAAALWDLLPQSTPAFSESMRHDQVTTRRRGVARRFRR